MGIVASIVSAVVSIAEIASAAGAVAEAAGDIVAAATAAGTAGEALSASGGVAFIGGEVAGASASTAAIASSSLATETVATTETSSSIASEIGSLSDEFVDASSDLFDSSNDLYNNIASQTQTGSAELSEDATSDIVSQMDNTSHQGIHSYISSLENPYQGVVPGLTSTTTVATASTITSVTKGAGAIISAISAATATGLGVYFDNKGTPDIGPKAFNSLRNLPTAQIIQQQIQEPAMKYLNDNIPSAAKLYSVISPLVSNYQKVNALSVF